MFHVKTDLLNVLVLMLVNQKFKKMCNAFRLMRCRCACTQFLLTYVCLLSATQSVSAQFPPLSSISPTLGDLDGDGVFDEVLAEPLWNNGTGRVIFNFSSESTSTFVLFGETPNELFGWSVCFIANTYNTAGPVLAIGIPGRDSVGVVMLYELQQIMLGNLSSPELLPRQKLLPVLESDQWFGFDIAPCFDVDGRGVEEIRIGSRFDTAGSTITRTYIYDAVIGYPIAVITPDVTSEASVPRPKSDSNLDGLVNEIELCSF